MTDYEKYVQLLKQQYAEIKTDAHLAEIRQMFDSHRETLDCFKSAKAEMEKRIRERQGNAENLAAFVSEMKNHFANLARLRELLYALRRFENISDLLKQTIRQLEEYCMNNLSLDDILKASAGAENLKQQAEQQQNAVEKIQSAYLVHQGLIDFFGGVNRQFQSMMQTADVNAKTADAFLALFEQHIPELSGLKFQIGRTKTGHAEVENLLKYCREEMTLYELHHCTEELKITVQQAEQQRMADEAERRRQEELRRQEAERRRQEELRKQEEERKRQEELKKQEEKRKRQEKLRKQQKEEERKKREGWLVANDNGTVTDPKTGLMWAAKDNGQDIDWHGAKKYCENYRGGGYKDWRMPTQDELYGLYESGSGYEVTAIKYVLPP